MTDPTTPPRENPPANLDSTSKRRKTRWVLAAGILVLLLIVAGIALLPSLASTSFGKRLILNSINNRIAGTVAIGSLSLSWFGGQSIENLQLLDPKDEPLLVLDHLTTELSLWGAVISKNYALGTTRARGLRVDIREDETGSTNLQRALARHPKTIQQTMIESEDASTSMPAPLSGKITLQEGLVTITAPAIEPVEFSIEEAGLDIPALDGAIQIKAALHSKQGDMEGNLHVEGTVEKLFSRDGVLTLGLARPNLTASAKDLSTEGIDRLCELGGRLSAALGKSLSLQIQAKAETDAVNLSLRANSPNMSAEDISIRMAGQRIESIGLPSLDFSLTREFFQVLTQPLGPDNQLRLEEDLDLILRIRRLSANTARFDPASIILDLVIEPRTDSDILLTGDEAIGKILIRNLSAGFVTQNLAEKGTLRFNADLVSQGKPGRFVIDGNVAGMFDAEGHLQLDKMRMDATVNLTGIPTGLIDRLAKQDGSLVSYLGPRIDLTAVAQSGGSKKTQVTLQLATAHLKSDAIRFELGDRISLKEAAQFRYTLTPKVFSGTASLARPTTIQVNLSKIDAPLKDLTLSKVSFSATATVDEFKLAGHGKTPGAALRRIVVPLKFDGPGNQATISLTAEAEAPNQEQSTPLTADLRFSGLLHEGKLVARQAAIDASVKLKSLPTTFLDAFSTGGNDLSQLVGPSVDLDAVLKRTGGETGGGSLTVSANSAHLRAQAQLNLGDSLTLAQPAQAILTLTPRGFSTLTTATPDPGEKAGPPDLTLTRPAKINLTLSKLKWEAQTAADKDTASFRPETAAFDMTLDAPSMVLRDRHSGRDFTISNLKAAASTSGLGKTLALSLNGQVTLSQTRGTPAAGHLRVTANLSNLFSTGGEWNPAELSAAIKGDVTNLPSGLVTALAGGSPELRAVLGERVDIKIDTQLTRMSGPITADVKSTNSSARIAGSIQDGNLRLRENLIAKVGITRELSKTVLKNVNPLLVSAIGSEKPIRLEVQREGFVFPIKKFDVKRIEVKRATLDPNKVIFDNGGLLGQLMRIFKQSRPEKLVAWFTPIELNVHNGLARYDRMDALVGSSFQFASWGAIDLDREYTNMILGLPAKTLRRSLRISGAPDGYVAQFPMRGPSGRVKMDYAAVGAALAKMAIPGGSSNPLGRFLGGIVGKAVFKDKAAPPAKHPFPWEKPAGKKK